MFLISLAVMIILVSIGFFVISSYLGSYTDHGFKQSVPDFSGMTIEEATELAETKELRLEVIDTIFQAEAEPGEIVDHSPKPGFLVKRNRNIFLTINSFTPEEVIMPDLRNESLRDANAILESIGLKVGRLSYQPYFARNLVLKQVYKGKQIAKGEKVFKGAAINLVLGSGATDKKVAVPNLVGLTYKEAAMRISSLSLNQGSLIFINSPENMEDSLKSLVVKQIPVYEQGAEVMLGEEIDLFFEKDSSLVDSAE